MQIVVNIDVEAIVREEIRAYVRENLVINNVPGANGVDVVIGVDPGKTDETVVTVLQTETLPINKPAAKPTVNAPEGGWEFAPKAGRRRNTAEIAMHNKELELGRLLTPEEKGIAQGHVSVDEDAEAKAKADTIKKRRIDGLVEELDAENEAEAAKKAAEEPKVDVQTEQFGDVTAEPEADSTDVSAIPFDKPIEASEETIPVAEDLPDIKSLFN